MNKKVKRVLKAKGYHEEGCFTYHDIKLAHMIVDECVKVCLEGIDITRMGEYTQRLNCANNIKKHFKDTL